MTKTQKENLKSQSEAAQKALDEKLKRMEAEDKIDEATLEKMKAEALALAVTEQQKLDVEKAFADKSYQLKAAELNDKMALYKKDSNEYKALQADKIKLDAEYVTTTTANKAKQKEITDKANKDLMDAEIQALNLKKAEGTIKEDEYQKAIYDIKKKYLTDKKDLIDAEIAYENYLTEQKKKKVAEERNIALSLIQERLNEFDRLNQIKQNDYDKDLERLAQKKLLLDDAEKLELSNTELTEYEKTVIKQKYADKRKEITAEETKTEKDYFQAQIQGITQTLDSLASVTSAVASLYDEEAKTSKDAFEKRKKLQIATAIMSAASGIIQILTQPSTLPSPFDWIVKGLNVVALGIATGVNIAKIKSTSFESSGGASSAASAGNSAASLGKNYGDGGMIEGPRHAQGGTLINAEGGEAVMTRGAVTMFGPLLSALNQSGGGTSFGNSMVSSYDNPARTNPAAEQQPMIMKTYVVSNELTTAAEKQARLKDLSTL